MLTQEVDQYDFTQAWKRFAVISSKVLDHLQFWKNLHYFIKPLHLKLMALTKESRDIDDVAEDN